MSDLAKFARDLSVAPALITAGIQAVGKRGAVNIKREMRRDAEPSAHFAQIAPTIGFDQTKSGPREWEWEIGPAKRRGGNLANIAYFGGAHGGGGTIRDPQAALDDEAPKLTAALAKVIGGIL